MADKYRGSTGRLKAPVCALQPITTPQLNIIPGQEAVMG